MKPIDFKDSKPELVIELYLRGETQAWGIF